MVNKEVKKAADYREDLWVAVGKWSDFQEYWMQLSDLEEKYDESIEVYNFNSWLGVSNVNIFNKAEKMLSVTSSIFYDLYDSAESELYALVCKISELNADVQQEIWGLEFTEGVLTKEEFQEMLEEWEYEYNVEDAQHKFLLILKGALERKTLDE